MGQVAFKKKSFGLHKVYKSNGKKKVVHGLQYNGSIPSWGDGGPGSIPGSPTNKNIEDNLDVLNLKLKLNLKALQYLERLSENNSKWVPQVLAKANTKIGSL